MGEISITKLLVVAALVVRKRQRSTVLTLIYW